MVWGSGASDLEEMAGLKVVVSGRETRAGRVVGWIGARPASLIYRGSFQSGGMSETERVEEKPGSASEGWAGSNCSLLKYKRTVHSHIDLTPMSRPFPPNTHLVLLAAVSALLILKAAKRASKKPSLLTDLKDASFRVVAGQQAFDSEYDIIIIGGGKSSVVSTYLG